MNNSQRFLLVGQAADSRPQQAIAALLAALGAVERQPECALPAVLPGDYALILIDAGSVSDATTLVGDILSRQPGARVVVLAASPHWSQVRAFFHAGAIRTVDPLTGPTELTAVLEQMTTDEARMTNGEQRSPVAPLPYFPALPHPRPAGADLINAERSQQERPIMRPLIMFVDNHIAFIDEWADWLEERGCRVYRAYDRWQAERILLQRHVHLAIVDIRLRDDTDATDLSGLDLAADERFSALPKIILTGHPTTDKAIKAMQQRVGRLAPAIDFVAKWQDPEDLDNKGQDQKEVLLAAVQQAMANWVHINPHLALDSAGVSLGSLLYDIHGAPAEESLSELVEELRDLFRKLFYDYDRLLLGRRFAHRRGLVFLEVTAGDKKNAERSFLVICGDKDAVRRDIENGQRWAAGGRDGWTPADAAETMNYAAAAYRLATPLSDVTPLAAFYERRPAEALSALIDQLFGRTVAELHRQDPGFDTTRLPAAFDAALRRRGLTPSRTALLNSARKLGDRASALGLAQVDWAAERLTFRLDGAVHEALNPLPRLFDKDAPALATTTLGGSHGHLTAFSILVDRQAQTRLIDFGRAGRGPLVEDYVTLELSIRFDLLNGLSLLARYRLEGWLLSAAPGDDPAAAGLDADSCKAAAVIGHIRHCAADRLGLDRQTYLTWLLIGASAHLAGLDPTTNWTRQELLPHLHCLLLIAMLGEHLFAPRISDDPHGRPMALDANYPNQVRVRGRPVELTPTEYRLLDYLYQRRNNKCTYEDIATDVLDRVLELHNGKPKAEEPDRNHIQQVVSGLREKIEADPSRPELLKNVRGIGYRLELAE